MKKLLLVLSLSLVFCGQAIAQQPEQSAEENASFEEIMLNSYYWLLGTPVESQPEKREMVEFMIMNWMVRAETLTVSMFPEIMGDPAELAKNPKLVFMWMGGYTAFLLEEKKKDGTLNQLENHVRGESLREKIEATYAAIRYCGD